MGLFWTMKKLCNRYNANLADGEIKLFIPEIETWENIYKALKSTEGSYEHTFGISVDTPRLGSFYKDGNVEITAFESHHLPPAENGDIRSFSFRIKAEGKTVVFSGDIKDMTDLIDTVGDGCDLLLCETGHHEVKAVCAFAEEHNVRRLVFLHHGREILENRPTVKAAIENCTIPVEIAFDGMEIEV